MKKPIEQDSNDYEKRKFAEELKEAFNLVSPFIEKQTSVVCPECKNVCCIDKHGRCDDNDMIFLRALGEVIAPELHDRDETDPCRYLTRTGCSRERWMRPYRCTYFFCDDLMKSMENENAKLYRTFLAYFEHLISLRLKLLG